jgi:hypothetical protein
MKPTSFLRRLGYAARLTISDPRLLADKLAWRARALGRHRTGESIARVLGTEMRFALDDGGPIWHMRYGGYDV